MSEQFWIIVIILVLIFLLAIWILLNIFFVDYVRKNVNSQEKLCETFEKVPLLGTITCPR